MGLPVNMNNTKGERVEKTMAFKEMLERRIGLPVNLWDERLTTVEADEIMTEVGVKGRQDRKKYVDKIAAMIILQDYMDNKKQNQE